MKDNSPVSSTTPVVDVIYGAANTFPNDDAELARVLDGKDIPHWSWLWRRINDLQRKGIVRVTPLNRYMARVTACPR